MSDKGQEAARWYVRGNRPALGGAESTRGDPMAEKYVCTTCGSETVNRTIKDARLNGTPDLVQVPAYCSNRSCMNADPKMHAFQWARIVED